MKKNVDKNYEVAIYQVYPLHNNWLASYSSRLD